MELFYLIIILIRNIESSLIKGKKQTEPRSSAERKPSGASKTVLRSLSRQAKVTVLVMARLNLSS